VFSCIFFEISPVDNIQGGALEAVRNLGHLSGDSDASERGFVRGHTSLPAFAATRPEDTTVDNSHRGVGAGRTPGFAGEETLAQVGAFSNPVSMLVRTAEPPSNSLGITLHPRGNFFRTEPLLRKALRLGFATSVSAAATRVRAVPATTPICPQREFKPPAAVTLLVVPVAIDR
jgi:hypothetical protein